MEIINLLLVEDDKDQQVLVEDAVEDFNDDNTATTFSVVKATNAADAIEHLKSNEFDAVMLDLLLEGDSNDSSASGNEVLNYIFSSKSLRPIVYVVSGTLHSLDEEYKEIFTTPLMYTYNRESESSEILNEIYSVWKTGVTKIIGRSGKLEKLLQDIYIKHLAQGFDFWKSKSENTESALLRYISMHLAEYLDMPEVVEDTISESRYFEAEFYIYPPIKDKVATGDIVIYEDNMYILLSPSCDVAPRIDGEAIIYNVDSVLLAEIIPLEKERFDTLGIKYHPSKTNNEKWKDFHAKQKRSQSKQRFHFLPAYLDIKESVIDFKRLRFIPTEDYLGQDMNRIATVSSPFIREIQSRFSAYFGRQGQPSGTWSSN